MSNLIAMLSHMKGNPGNGYRPESGTVCLVSGPNCDNEDGYTYMEMTILWCNETFVLYGKDGCWPNLNKWDHILCQPLDGMEDLSHE